MASNDAGVPTDEEIAAVLAAVRLLLRRRDHTRETTGSHWARAGRVEAVTGVPGIASWASAERPR